MANKHTAPRLTTLCYAEKEDAYLMLHRVKKVNDVNKDKWIGIGGHFEEGESPEECIRREALEETGLTLNKLRFRGIVTFCFREPIEEYDGEHWDDWEYMCLFTATVEDDELSECNEGDLEWVKKERIGALNLWEGDKVFFRLLSEGVPFFSLKLCYHGDKLMRAELNGEPLEGYERQYD